MMVVTVDVTRGRHLVHGDLGRGAEILRRGGISIVPSDTVYAAAVDVSNRNAVALLRAALGMPDAPISVAVDSQKRIADYAQLGMAGGRITELLMPGPITLVAPMTELARRQLGYNLGPQETIGLRLTDSPVERQLVEAIGGPISTTAIRDDRGDLVADFTEAREIVEKGLEYAAEQLDLLPTLFPVRSQERFLYDAHSTVAEQVGRGLQVREVRPGRVPWKRIVEATRTYSRWDIGDWT